MANKLRNWRPSEGFYESVRAALKEEQQGWNDQEMIDYICGAWLSGQCDSHSIDDSAGVMPQSDSHREEIEELREGMRKLQSMIIQLKESQEGLESIVSDYLERI